MKVLLLSLLLSVSALGQGIYADFGVKRIYCFAEDGDIELELVQGRSIYHSFKTLGADIFNVDIIKRGEQIPNGVTIYLNNLERSPISFIIDYQDNVLIEGLDALTGTREKYSFHCDLE